MDWLEKLEGQVVLERQGMQDLEVIQALRGRQGLVEHLEHLE